MVAKPVAVFSFLLKNSKKVVVSVSSFLFIWYFCGFKNMSGLSTNLQNFKPEDDSVHRKNTNERIASGRVDRSDLLPLTYSKIAEPKNRSISQSLFFLEFQITD